MDNVDWDQPRSSRYWRRISPNRRLIMFLRSVAADCAAAIRPLTFQFFYGAVEQEVRPDFETFGNSQENRQ